MYLFKVKPKKKIIDLIIYHQVQVDKLSAHFDIAITAPRTFASFKIHAIVWWLAHLAGRFACYTSVIVDTC